MAEKYQEFEAFFGALEKLANEATALQNDYNSYTEKDDSVVKEAFNDENNEAVKKFKKYEEDANAQIAAIREKVKAAKASTVKSILGDRPQADPEVAKEKRNAWLDKVNLFKTTSDNVLRLMGNDEVAFKAGLDAHNVVAPKRARNSTASTSTGDIVRKRLSAATYNGESLEKPTFTNLQLKSGVKGEVIRKAAADAAGVSSVKDIPAGQTVEFTVTQDEKNHTFSITTKDSE